MSDTVEQICLRAQAGSREAAAELVECMYEPIFAYLRRVSGHPEDAADLTQKTFAKAWTALASYKGRSRFSTWLHGIAHHVYVDWRRQRKPDSPQTDEWWAACPAPTPSPFENAAGQDSAHRLYALVDHLDEDARQTLHLHYYQELSIAETAEVLGVATSTVKYRVRGALELLRTRMADPKPIHS
jgi:RNA polymerase sigma-70 factor (ECF subfamily)